VRTVSVGLKLVLSQWSPNADRAAKDVDKVTAAVQRVGDKSKSWDKVGKASAVAAVGGALALKKLTGVTMDFDKAMSGVGAVANASAGDLGRLREAALQAGADTAFSASQAATAEAELAKAGVSTADILGGALKGSLDLAAAGQLDLGEAATISAQAMNIWKLRGSDVAHIADVLAAGANKSAADVGQLGDAMRQGGLVAAQMGVGMEDTVAVLSAFADNALIGSDAGTSLKTMLQKLMAPSKEAAAAMADIGLHAFDASGQFVGMENFAGQLQDRLGNLTQEQRSSALATIFGSDAIRAANVLYDIGAGGVADYSKAVNDQGAAARMASTQMDNLAGDLEALRGSVETALIKGGSGATAALRGMTQAATGAVNVFGDLPGPVQAAAVGLLALGTAGAGAMFVFGSVAPRLKTARAELEGMGRAGEIASIGLGKIGKGLAIGTGVLIGVEALSAGLNTVQDAIVDTVPGVNELTQSLLSAESASQVLSVLGGDAEQFGQRVRVLADPSIAQNVGRIGDALFGLKPKSLREASDQIGGLDQALVGLVSSGHQQQAANLFQTLADAASVGGASIEDLREALPAYRDALAGTAVQSKLADEGTKGLGDAAGGATGNVEDVAQATDELGHATRAFTGVARDAKGELVQYGSAADILLAKLTALSGGNLSALDAEIAFREAVAGVTSSLKDNGATVDLNTAKGRANASAIGAAIRAAQTHAGAITDLSTKTHSNAYAVSVGNAAYRRQVDALWRVARQSGMTRAQFDLLTGAVKAVPKRAETKTTAPGAVDSKVKLSTVTREANNIPRSVATRVRVDGAVATLAALDRVADKLYAINGTTATTYVNVVHTTSGTFTTKAQQTGGKVGGVGTGDSQLRLLDPREWVIRPESVSFYGDALLAAINNRTWRPAGPAPAAARPVAGTGPVVNITVNAPAGMDVGALAAEVSRRIGKQTDLRLRAR
jgi:TP901 family phage tail tape measure protein